MKSINAEKGLKTIYGNSSVIISAPHSTMHARNGSIRASETRISSANPYCVSTYIAQRSNILTFQIEINRKHRSAKYKEFCKYTKLLKAMVDVVKLLDNEKNFKA